MVIYVLLNIVEGIIVREKIGLTRQLEAPQHRMSSEPWEALETTSGEEEVLGTRNCLRNGGVEEKPVMG